MRRRVLQTVLVWLASIAVSAALAAVPGISSIVIAAAFVITLIVADRGVRRLGIASDESPDSARAETAAETADWRSFLPTAFGTAAALAITELSIADPPARFLPDLVVVSAVAVGAFLITDEVFRRRPVRR